MSAWCAQRNKHDMGKKMLARFNRNVPGYDIDYQYQILVKVVEHEQAVAAEQRREKWYSIFRGVNGVSRRRTLHPESVGSA